jgi:hypothetical protein
MPHVLVCFCILCLWMGSSTFQKFGGGKGMFLCFCVSRKQACGHYLSKKNTILKYQTPNALLLHWRQLSCAAAVSSPIVIALPSHSALCCRCCPSPLPPSIAIMPPSIVIAAAVHLALPPIAPLLHQQQSSATHCAIHHPIAYHNCFVFPLPIALPSLPIAAWAALRVSYSQHRLLTE